jgi:phospholipase/carboxylesterase
MKDLDVVEVESAPGKKVQGSVIWLHGLGANGYDFVSAVPELALPDSLAIRFIFPHAPELPVTINGGFVMPAWYDILEMTLDRKVDVAQLCASAEKIHQLIAREIARGVEAKNIVLIGFSQGGAVVYQAGLSCAQKLGGLIVLSSYFATHETLQLHDNNVQVPIAIQHGTQDEVVDESLGRRALLQLSERGCNVHYETFPIGHSVGAEQLAAIAKYLLRWIS